jgi:hypothetical protein
MIRSPGSPGFEFDPIAPSCRITSWQPNLVRPYYPPLNRRD